MLKKLKQKFVLLSACLTGLVLLIACIFAYYAARTQAESTYNEAFEYQSQTLSVLLAGSTELNHSQIYQMENEGGILIFLFDNGKAMNVVGGENLEQREKLYDTALEQLEKTDSDYIVTPNQRYREPINITVQFTQDNNNYRAKFISAPTGPRKWYSAVLIKPTLEQERELSKLKYPYIAIFFGGLILLVVISWILAKRSVAPVEKAQERQKEFIATASHELKSPLAVVSTSIDLAEKDKENSNKYLNNARNEAKRMSSLVEDLLLLAGSDTGKWTIKKSKVNIEDVMVNAYECFFSIAKSKEQALKLDMPSEVLPEIMADEERIIQVLSILLSNAINYSPCGTTIELHSHTTKQEIFLSVIDHGKGIKAEDKEHIFESFYRIEQSHTDKSHFGLGLAVAHELILLHGGELTLADTPGGGATFTFTLPLEG